MSSVGVIHTAGINIPPKVSSAIGSRKMQSGLIRQCIARVGSTASHATSATAKVLRRPTYNSLKASLDVSAKASSRRRFVAMADGDGGGRAVTTAKPTKEGKMQKIDTNPPRGTRDFAPQDMRLRNWLFEEFRKVSQRVFDFFRRVSDLVPTSRTCVNNKN
jgi:hypothetical protein